MCLPLFPGVNVDMNMTEKWTAVRKALLIGHLKDSCHFTTTFSPYFLFLTIYIFEIFTSHMHAILHSNFITAFVDYFNKCQLDLCVYILNSIGHWDIRKKKSVLEVDRKCSQSNVLIYFLISTCVLSWKLGWSACLAKGDPMEISLYRLFMNTEHI